MFISGITNFNAASICYSEFSNSIAKVANGAISYLSSSIRSKPKPVRLATYFGLGSLCAAGIGALSFHPTKQLCTLKTLTSIQKATIAIKFLPALFLSGLCKGLFAWIKHNERSIQLQKTLAESAKSFSDIVKKYPRFPDDLRRTIEAFERACQEGAATTAALSIIQQKIGRAVHDDNQLQQDLENQKNKFIDLISQYDNPPDELKRKISDFTMACNNRSATAHHASQLKMALDAFIREEREEYSAVLFVINDLRRVSTQQLPGELQHEISVCISVLEQEGVAALEDASKLPQKIDTFHKTQKQLKENLKNKAKAFSEIEKNHPRFPDDLRRTIEAFDRACYQGTATTEDLANIQQKIDTAIHDDNQLQQDLEGQKNKFIDLISQCNNPPDELKREISDFTKACNDRFATADYARALQESLDVFVENEQQRAQIEQLRAEIEQLRAERKQPAKEKPRLEVQFTWPEIQLLRNEEQRQNAMAHGAKHSIDAANNRHSGRTDEPRYNVLASNSSSEQDLEKRRFQLKTRPEDRQEACQVASKMITASPNYWDQERNSQSLAAQCNPPSYGQLIYLHANLKLHNRLIPTLQQKPSSLHETPDASIGKSGPDALQISLLGQRAAKAEILASLKTAPDFLYDELLKDLLGADLSPAEINQFLLCAIKNVNLPAIKQLLNLHTDVNLISRKVVAELPDAAIEWYTLKINPFKLLMKIDNMERFKQSLDEVNPKTLEASVINAKNLSEWMSSNMAFALTLATHKNSTNETQKKLFESGASVFKRAFLLAQPHKNFLKQFYSIEIANWAPAFFGEVYRRLSKASPHLPGDKTFRKTTLHSMLCYMRKQNAEWRKTFCKDFSEEQIDELSPLLNDREVPSDSE